MVKQSAICVLVIDGDTFVTNTEVRIRLTRVSAPPISTSRGQRAKTILESLIPNKRITYEQVAIDSYGRTLAEVWLNSTNVNDIMIRYGYGQ